MRYATWAWLVLASLTLVPSVLAQPTASDPEVLEGIAQVEDGEYATAILTLDRAARRLSRDPDKARELSQAYLYLGIAYFGQGHEAASRARFRDAIRHFRDISLNPELYPPAIINLFEAAREEAGEPVAARNDGGGSSRTLLLLGAGGAVAAGVALAVGRDSSAPAEEPVTSRIELTQLSPAAGSTIVVAEGTPPGAFIPFGSGLLSVGLSIVSDREVPWAQLNVYLLDADGYCGQNTPDSPTWGPFVAGQTYTHTVTGFQIYNLPCRVTGIRAMLHTRNSGLLTPPNASETVAEGTFTADYLLTR